MGREMIKKMMEGLMVEVEGGPMGGSVKVQGRTMESAVACLR